MNSTSNAESQKEFPFEIKALEEAIQEKIRSEFGRAKVQVGPEKWVMYDTFGKFANKIYNFEARASDVFICSYPRSGTTWTQEMIWLICNELNYEEAKNTTLSKRFPFFEFNILIDGTGFQASKERVPGVDGDPNRIFEFLQNQTKRRFIKTHLPIQLLPHSVLEVGAKVVYIARNPKDVAVSNFHFIKSTLKSNFEVFSDFFLQDLVLYEPYWKHIVDSWSHRNDENFHFVFYEDAKSDLKSFLRNLSSFLGNPLKDDDYPKLMEHLKFENVKENLSINISLKERGFCRRGKVGGNPEMTEEISKKFDEWTKKSLEGLDISFPSGWPDILPEQ